MRLSSSTNLLFVVSIVLVCFCQSSVGQAGTPLNGVTVLASDKFVHYLFSLQDYFVPFFQSVLPSLTFNLPDYYYSTNTTSAHMSNIYVTVQNLNNVSATLVPDVGINFQFVNVSITVSWTLNWNVSKSSNSTAAITTVLFDLSAIPNITSFNQPGYQPIIGLNSLTVQKLTFVQQNYHLPPEVENLPNIFLQQLISNNLSMPLSNAINFNYMSSAWSGFLPFISNPELANISPGFIYYPLSIPQYINNTMILEINGDIGMFPTFYTCKIPHQLPTPIPPRQHDIELYISIADFTCLFEELIDPSVPLAPQLNGLLFDPNSMVTVKYSYPFDPNNVTFVPVTNSDHIVVKTSPLNLTVTFQQNMMDVISISPVINISLAISLLPGQIGVNASVSVTDLTITVLNYALVPPKYAAQVLAQDTNMLIQLINSKIPSPLPVPPISSAFLTTLWNAFENPSLSTTTGWVKFQADLKQ